jgi:uncharacterized protein (UPF0248 family)
MKPTTLRYVKSDYHLAKRQTKATMKKLINKLFEHLGYVPKEDTEQYKRFYDSQQRIDKSILDEETVFFVSDKKEYYLVCSLESIRSHRAIKLFYKRDNPDYARLLAEELCEKLNEKY